MVSPGRLKVPSRLPASVTRQKCRHPQHERETLTDNSVQRYVAPAFESRALPRAFRRTFHGQTDSHFRFDAGELQAMRQLIRAPVQFVVGPLFLAKTMATASGVRSPVPGTLVNAGVAFVIGRV
jgi:hypothetical protein